MSEFISLAVPEDFREARALLRAYEAGVGVDLCFEGFEEELRDMERIYGPAGGGEFLLLRAGGQTAGCVVLHDLGDGVCEMRRLFVRPSFRGCGLGRKCAEEGIRVVRKKGCDAVRLATLPSMREAISLYRSMGFAEISPCDETRAEGVLFMELRLDRGRCAGTRRPH